MNLAKIGGGGTKVHLDRHCSLIPLCAAGCDLSSLNLCSSSPFISLTHLSPSVLLTPSFLDASSYQWLWEALSSATGKVCTHFPSLITNSVRYSTPFITIIPSACEQQAGRQSWRGFDACRCRILSTFHPFLQLAIAIIVYRKISLFVSIM